MAKIESVTPELLAMRWGSESQAKAFLLRSGTSLKKLGLMVVMAPDEGVCVQLVEPVKGDTAISTATVPLAEATTSADPEFELYANEVDALLEAAKEEPVGDATLREYLRSGLTAQQAVDAVVEARSAKLQAAVDKPTPIEQPNQRILSRAAKSKQLRDKLRAEAPAKPKHTRVTTSGRAKDKREAERAAAAVVMATGRTDAPLPEAQPAPEVHPQRALQLRIERTFDVDERFSGLAARLAKQTGFTFIAVDPFTHEEHYRFPVAEKKVGPRNQNTLPVILEMLARDNGASGSEVKERLGWDNIPGPWFFKHWTKQAKRAEGDLVHVGRDADGSHRYRLPAAA